MVEDFEEFLLMDNQFDKFDMFPLDSHTPYYCKYKTKKGEIKEITFSLERPVRWIPHNDIWKFKDTSGKWNTINLNNIIEFHKVEKVRISDNAENWFSLIYDYTVIIIILIFLFRCM